MSITFFQTKTTIITKLQNCNFVILKNFYYFFECKIYTKSRNTVSIPIFFFIIVWRNSSFSFLYFSFRMSYFAFRYFFCPPVPYYWFDKPSNISEMFEEREMEMRNVGLFWDEIWNGRYRYLGIFQEKRDFVFKILEVLWMPNWKLAYKAFAHFFGF